jgi:hypothetical protein
MKWLEPDMMDILITAGVLGMISWFSYTLGYAKAVYDRECRDAQNIGLDDVQSAEDAARRTP